MRWDQSMFSFPQHVWTPPPVLKDLVLDLVPPHRQSCVIITKVLCLLLLVLGDVDPSLWARWLMPGVPEAAGKTDPARPTRISPSPSLSTATVLLPWLQPWRKSGPSNLKRQKMTNFYFGGTKSWKRSVNQVPFLPKINFLCF